MSLYILCSTCDNDSAFYKRELKKNDAKLVSVLENLDNSPESIILESVLQGMAEYYSANLARETMKGLMENALQCKHTGGIPPLGYDISINYFEISIWNYVYHDLVTQADYYFISLKPSMYLISLLFIDFSILMTSSLVNLVDFCTE